ncbi:hypothetical protein FG379_003061 [Cryptosporidium bovis]|uniref:uncharacterized protein n=1 Tax=Cryptosporidium bovis TaxID=310047 RepID=UPI00351AA006|nr:hypothetical protein FG379_003061 [Cryptosporidium bovis]
MDGSSPEQLVRTRYAEVLRNLRSPAGSGKMIQNLTLLAEDQRQYAHIIASVILEEIPRSDIPRKYVLLCLVDSIVRKCRSGSIFFPYFLPYIAPYFAEAYTTKTPTQILRSLEKLLKVWNESFPRDIVKKLISTTNSVRSKLNEPPLELEIKVVLNNSTKQSTDVSALNQTPEPPNTQKEANILNDIYTQVSKSIIQKANITDENNVLLSKLIKDPNVHKITYLSSQGKVQESQSLFNILVSNLENSKVDTNNSTGMFQPPHKKIKQDNLDASIKHDDKSISNKCAIPHSTSTSSISGKPPSQMNLVQTNIQNTIIGTTQVIPHANTSSVLPSSSVAAAAAEAAAAAAAEVVQSKTQIQQKHSSGLISNQHITIPSQSKILPNQLVVAQQIVNSNVSNVNTQIKKTFSPRFSENNTSAILLSIWNQLFTQNDVSKNVDTKKLIKIKSSIVDGMGDQNIFVEGLHINEMNDLLLLYKKLQENVDASVQFKKTVWLKSHFIKKRIIDNICDFNIQYNISMYYFDRPNQCHTCGCRFVDSKKKELHIQIHLSRNLIFKQKKQTWNSQVLWPNLQDWIYGSDNLTENATRNDGSIDSTDCHRDKSDRNTGNMTEIGSSFLSDVTGSQSEKDINYNDLYDIILKRFSKKSDEIVCLNGDSNMDKFKDGIDDESYHQTCNESVNRRLRGDLLLVHYMDCIESINSANSNNTIKGLVNSSGILEYTSVYIDNLIIKEVEDICNNLSSLWNEMSQCVASSCTPIDPLHITCDICHESLRIKWSSLLKSWISVDAVALTLDDGKDTINEEKNDIFNHKLSLAVLDRMSDVNALNSSNTKERIVDNMLKFIQWKSQNTSSKYYKKIEFKPFDIDYYNYNLFINRNQGIMGDRFVAAHKSCFIHYFVYNDINFRLPANTKISKKKKYIHKDAVVSSNILREAASRIDTSKSVTKRFSFI